MIYKCAASAQCLVRERFRRNKGVSCQRRTNCQVRNHVPDVPIGVSPFFAWPPKPARMGHWVAQRWLRIAENSILALIALGVWLWFQPSLETTITLQADWIFGLWLRNLILMTGVAGGLHWYFYKRKGQRSRLKYDRAAWLIMQSSLILADRWDNVFWTLTSGVGFWTAYEVLLFWAMANGYAPVLIPSDHPIWFFTPIPPDASLDLVSFLLDT